MFRLRKKPVTLLAALLFTILLSVPAMALNYNGTGGGSGNKSFNFNGYKFDNAHRDQLLLYFDKSSSTANIVADQFAVEEDGGSGVTISSRSLSSGTNYSGCSDANLTQGTTVTLTFSANLDREKRYKVTMKAGTIANNNGLTLGNYNYRNDIVFYFCTPDADGNYTTAISSAKSFTFLPNITSNVPFEGNVVLVVDRPIYDIAAFKTAMDTNFRKGSWQGTTVTKDDTIDGNAVTGAECYTSHANTAKTAVFFPETANTNNYTVYNLDTTGSRTYTLTVPSFNYKLSNDDDAGSYSTTSAADYTFTTVAGDIAGWLDNTPTVANPTSSTIDVSWATSGITPNTSISYDVYYSSTGQWGDYTKLNITSISGTSPFTFVAGDTDDNSRDTLDLTNNTYYFRIVPINSGGEAGFSLAVRSN